MCHQSRHGYDDTERCTQRAAHRPLPRENDGGRGSSQVCVGPSGIGPAARLLEGDGWVNWSGLATLATALPSPLVQSVDRLLSAGKGGDQLKLGVVSKRNGSR